MADLPIPPNPDPGQTAAFSRCRYVLLISLVLWAAAATFFVDAAPYSGHSDGRISLLLTPFVLCMCCCLVVVFKPRFAVGFVVTTLTLTGIGSALLLPVFLMLLFGWGGSRRSAEDSRLLYSLVGTWITNGVALVAAIRYARVLWSSISQEEILFGSLAPLLLVLLVFRTRL